jgi:DNA ligase-1
VALLHDLVATSAAVAATRARSEKVAHLAAAIGRLVGDDEVACGVSFLTGEPRQGQVGVGWAALSAVRDAPPADAPTVTVLDLDRAIAELAAMGGAGSASQRQAALTALFARLTDDERNFVVRLFGGELRQGALAGVVTDAVAKSAGVPLAAVRRAAMLAGDLPRVAAIAMASGADGLAAVGLQPLHPVQPMLASTSASVAEAMATVGGEVSVEWKLDGARVQAHRDGDEVRLYTRNLNDVTSRLGGVVSVVRELACRSVVLDGEVIGMAEEDERPDAFQSTMSRFGRQDGVAGGGLVVRFFDVLHLDGVDLIDAPLSTRLATLDALVGPWRVPGVVTSDADEATAFAEHAVGQGHEGVMVKAVTSTYDAGRRGGAWRKVKPVRTLDLVVLGAEWGHGRRQGWLSNLHLGARDPSADGGYVMVGKTFKGLTDALLMWQTERLRALAVEERGIAVFVRPELVVEIALDGAQTSTRYPGGVALRFARVKRYREDKEPHEADTIDDVRALLPPDAPTPHPRPGGGGAGQAGRRE